LRGQRFAIDEGESCKNAKQESQADQTPACHDALLAGAIVWNLNPRPDRSDAEPDADEYSQAACDQDGLDEGGNRHWSGSTGPNNGSLDWQKRPEGC
jgi:hypothetical protein